MPPSPSSAFPRGTYAKYKRATSYFLSWLLRARHGGVATASFAIDTATEPLDAYERIVHAVVARPHELAPSLLQRLPLALEACASAITLRERVALFFGDAADATHAHFLTKLKSWFASLARVAQTFPCVEKREHTAPGTLRDFSNYYDVLGLPDDYFDVDEEKTNDVEPSLSKTDKKRVEIDAFADDFDTELACLLMELEELSEAVYTTYLDVKREQRTLVEATVVAKIAIDSAASIIANLELRYPEAIKDGVELSQLIQDRLSLDQLKYLVASVQTAWRPSEDATEIKNQYVPGTILVDMVGIVRVLRSVAKHKGGRMAPVGERYDEVATPHYVVPEWGLRPDFFMFHLPDFLQFLIDLRSANVTLAPNTLEAWLLEPFDSFATTKKVTIHLVFVCVCWIRSVAALQGNRGLARTMGLSIMHMADLSHRLSASTIAHHGRHPLDDQKAALLKSIDNRLDVFSPHMRVNPLLAGCVMLDQDIEFLTLGHYSLLLSLFRPLCHIYSALRDRQLIEHIPFLEATIQVYEATLFTSSRAAATHGSYARSFLASHSLMEGATRFRLGRDAPRRPGQAISTVEKALFTHLSHIAQLLRANDFSVLPAVSSVSWTTLLSAAADLCAQELFESRVLSRDVNKLSDDVEAVFYSICDAMDRRAHLDGMIARGNSRLRALENTVVFSLLPVLDKLADADLSQPNEVSAEAVSVCRRAASVLSRQFGTSHDVESHYYTFAAGPAWVSTEFTRSQPGGNAAKSPVNDEFFALWAILVASQTALRGDSLEEFKRRVIATPVVLMMCHPDQTIEQRTLLQLTAAGPAHDLYLTEWLVQMSAADLELPLCRNPDFLSQMPDGVAVDVLPDAFAVHCAARRGLDKMVRFLLGAGNFRDIDARTFHTKESLLHIAVKEGHDNLCVWLLLHGADMLGVDASGRHVWDVAANREWKARLKQLAATQKTEQEKNAKCERDGWISTKSREELARLSSEARHFTQAAVLADTPLGPVSLGTNQPTARSEGVNPPAGRNGKKTKKKQKKSKTKQASQSNVAATPDLMGQLLLGGSEDGRIDKLSNLTTALEELKTNRATDREACATLVLTILEHYSSSLDTMQASGLLSHSASVKGEVRNAARVVFLLHSFQPNYHREGVQEDVGLAEQSLQERISPAAGTRFYSFFVFMLKTSVLLRLCHVTHVEEEVLEVMEQCLLSITNRSQGYRKMVSEYVRSRKALKPKKTIASLREAQRQFEWYASDHGVEDRSELQRIDALYGCSHFIRVEIVDGTVSSSFASCRSLIDETMPFERDAVYESDCIIAGAETTSQLDEIKRVILDAANKTNLRLQYKRKDLQLTSVEILGFTFSAAGIMGGKR